MTVSRTVGDQTKSAPRLYLALQLLKKITNEEAQTLQDQGAVVFLLYRNKIANDILKDLEEFIYIPLAAGERQTDIIKWVSKYIPRSSFQALGPTPAGQVDDLLHHCQQLTDDALGDGTIYKVVQGPQLKGFYVRIAPTPAEGDKLFVSPVFGPNKHIEYEVEKGALTKMTDLALPKEVVRHPIREAYQQQKKYAFVVDGHNMLYRAAFANWAMFSNDRKYFIGGAVGFYNTLLRLCRAHPEYEMHFVFDPDPTIRRVFGWTKSEGEGHVMDATTVAARMQSIPEYKANRDRLKDKFYEELGNNLMWVLRFLKACGFNVYSHPHHEGDNILGALVGDIRRKHPEHEIIIYSTDTDMLQLVDTNTHIYKPKARAFDFNNIIRLPEVLEQFPVGHPSKINWARAVIGDSTDNILSAYRWIKAELKVNQILYTKKVYDAVVASQTEDEYKAAISAMTPELAKFIAAKYDDNVSLLSIRTEIEGIELKKPVPYDEQAMQELLRNINLYKEIELFHEKVLPTLASYS